MVWNKGVIMWVGEIEKNHTNQELCLNSIRSDWFYRVKLIWAIVCCTGSSGECRLPSYSRLVIADCSYMMTYDPNQVQSSSPVFQIVACSGFWPDPELCWENAWPCSQVLLWFTTYEFFPGRKFMSGCLFFTKRILNLPLHSLTYKVNGFFYYQ